MKIHLLCDDNSVRLKTNHRFSAADKRGCSGERSTAHSLPAQNFWVSAFLNQDGWSYEKGAHDAQHSFIKDYNSLISSSPRPVAS